MGQQLTLCRVCEHMGIDADLETETRDIKLREAVAAFDARYKSALHSCVLDSTVRRFCEQ